MGLRGSDTVEVVFEARVLAKAVRATVAQVREKPDEASAVVLEVAGEVVLDLVDAAPGTAGWVRVRHRDGAAGFVRISQVWGV